MARTARGICMAALLAAGAAARGAEPAAAEREVVPITAAERRELRVQLPPGADVQTVDAEGKTWRETGEIGASYAVAREQMRGCLERQGWRLRRQIPLPAGKPSDPRQELTVWERGPRRILVLVWELEPGRSGFGWGIET